MTRNVHSRGVRRLPALPRSALLLLASLALPLAGCTFGTRYVALSYPPDGSDEEKVAAGASAGAAVARTAGVVLDVDDARVDSERIGAVRNTYGIVTASILTEDNIAIWAHDAIRTELEALGYAVVLGTEGDALDAYDRLSAQLTKLYCDIYMFYDGEVTLRATLHPVQGATLGGEFPAKVNSGLSFAASDEGAGQSLAQAMQESARAMLAEFGFVSQR